MAKLEGVERWSELVNEKTIHVTSKTWFIVTGVQWYGAILLWQPRLFPTIHDRDTNFAFTIDTHRLPRAQFQPHHYAMTWKRSPYYWLVVRGDPSVPGWIPLTKGQYWWFFVVSRNKLWNKQPRYRLFETPRISCDFDIMWCNSVMHCLYKAIHFLPNAHHIHTQVAQDGRANHGVSIVNAKSVDLCISFAANFTG